MQKQNENKGKLKMLPWQLTEVSYLVISTITNTWLCTAFLFWALNKHKCLSFPPSTFIHAENNSGFLPPLPHKPTQLNESHWFIRTLNMKKHLDCHNSKTDSKQTKLQTENEGDRVVIVH